MRAILATTLSFLGGILMLLLSRQALLSRTNLVVICRPVTTTSSEIGSATSAFMDCIQHALWPYNIVSGLSTTAGILAITSGVLIATKSRPLIPSFIGFLAVSVYSASLIVPVNLGNGALPFLISSQSSLFVAELILASLPALASALLIWSLKPRKVVRV